MSDLPPPLTPARSDLRDFGYMPLEIVRFRGSDLVAVEEPEAIVAALMLWTAAWHETPSASLTDDDRLLAKAAGYGRAVAAFQAVKAGAMRGFVKCSDGRLYHPVVARLANEAWKGKVEQRYRTEVGRLKKHNERHPDNQLAIPSFELFAAHYPDECKTDQIKLSQGQLGLDPAPARARTGASSMPDDEKTGRDECRDDSDQLSQGQDADVAATDPDCRDETGSKGESRESKGNLSKTPPKPPEPETHDLMDTTQRIANAGGVSIIQPTKITRAMDLVKSWLADGIDVETTILPTIAKRLADMRDDETVGSLSYFDAAIRKAHALKAGKPRPNGTAKPKPINVKDEDDERIVTIREQLRSTLGARTYDGWLAPAHMALAINGVGLIVKARKGFMVDWLHDHMERQLVEVARSTGIENVEFVGI